MRGSRAAGWAQHPNKHYSTSSTSKLSIPASAHKLPPSFRFLCVSFSFRFAAFGPFLHAVEKTRQNGHPNVWKRATRWAMTRGTAAACLSDRMAGLMQSGSVSTCIGPV